MQQVYQDPTPPFKTRQVHGLPTPSAQGRFWLCLTFLPHLPQLHPTSHHPSPFQAPVGTSLNLLDEVAVAVKMEIASIY